MFTYKAPRTEQSRLSQSNFIQHVHITKYPMYYCGDPDYSYVARGVLT